MNREGRIRRSRGAVSGVLLILLGAWGGLAPFAGPYFHFGFSPDRAWAYDSGRLYYSAIPGAVALLAGLMVTATRSRAAGVTGGLAAAAAGGWFALGQSFVAVVLNRPTLTAGSALPPAGPAAASEVALRAYLERVACFSGLGALLMVVGGIAMGRMSLLAASDMADGDYDDYDTGAPLVTPARSGPAPASPTSVGQIPAGGLFDPAPRQYPATSQYTQPAGPPPPPAAASWPDAATEQYQPPDAR